MLPYLHTASMTNVFFTNIFRSNKISTASHSLVSDTQGYLQLGSISGGLGKGLRAHV